MTQPAPCDRSYIASRLAASPARTIGRVGFAAVCDLPPEASSSDFARVDVFRARGEHSAGDPQTVSRVPGTHPRPARVCGVGGDSRRSVGEEPALHSQLHRQRLWRSQRHHRVGSAAMVGHGKPIRRATLRGSAHGVFTSQTCVLFSGTAVLKGTAGSFRLSAHRARACASGTNPNRVAFSGTANVSRGTGRFRGAHGIVSFHGTYARNSGAVTISLTGKLTY